ncbi:MAG: hypothetical protein ACP5US_05835 [Candidatus Kryptoniota bacterium]
MLEAGEEIRFINYATGVLKMSRDSPHFACELTKVLQLVNEINPAVLFIDAILPEELEMSLHLIFWRKEKPINVLIINMGMVIPEGQPDFSTYAKEISDSAPACISPVTIYPEDYTRTIEICWCNREWYFRLIEYSTKS